MERTTFDLWTIVHFLAGVLIGALSLLLSTHWIAAIIVSSIVAFVWEVWEAWVLQWEETFPNRVVDIAVIIVGVGIVYWINLLL